MSRVDVVVPCYKYGAFLPHCVRSVLGQDGVDVRVLVIDDASPDDTADVARRLADEDARVQVRRHPANRGHIPTYNEGLLGWAEAEYSLLLSADDMLTPGALRRAVDLLDTHPSVGFAYGRAVLTAHPEAEPTPGPPDPGRQVIRGDAFVEGLCRLGGNPILTPTVVVRTELQREVGGYRENVPHAGDLEMWLRFAMRADVGRLDAAQAFYRVHGQSMTTAYAGVANFRQMAAAFDGALGPAGDGDGGDRWGRLRELAHRSMAEVLVGLACTSFDRGDLDGSRPYADLAPEVWPPIRSARSFVNLRRKYRLGPRAWGLLQPVVRGVRRLTAPA